MMCTGERLRRTSKQKSTQRSTVRLSTRLGFTLIEVIVAMTLTAIVLAIAAAALGAATSARARVEAHQQTFEADSRLRALLSNMLRHAPSADAVDEPMLHVDRDAAGEPTLVFLSTGVREPFGTGTAWRVSVHRDSSSLVVDATPLGRDPSAAPLHMALNHITEFDVRVLEASRAGERAQWRRDWPVLRARPQLVEMRIGSNSFAPTPFIVSLAPFEERQ